MQKKQSMKNIHLIFPHQLFKNNPLFEADGEYYLIEEYLFFRQYRFHQQKIAFHRANMKYYENYLLKKGLKVTYIDSTSDLADIRKLLSSSSFPATLQISLIDPTDDWLMQRIQKVCQQRGWAIKCYESPLFLNTNESLQGFFQPGKKKYLQTEFYKQERIKRKILMTDNGGPLGGQWTYDVENRKKFPRGKTAVKVNYPPSNNYSEEARQYTLKNYAHHPGALTADFRYPVGFEESEQWLQQFLANRLCEFGEYEDAIVQKEILLNHSLLSPVMNIGMISPAAIIEKTIQHCDEHEIPLNSSEGFIRQLMGWREFIRGIYRDKGVAQRTRNYWGFKRKIPAGFYDGSTGILPVDETIKKVLKTGYCHHIERLMILGNFMLLCEFDPDEVYRWFMELFIDAYDWVMVPNIYGMSQFADGGLMATKPYISGSNYLMKMSDYPKGPWQEVWDALFWRFLDKQRAFFSANPRMGMLLKSYDGWDQEKRNKLQQKATEFLNTLDSENPQ
jgi:deoxyribodipyrimidine photolyase-related protein